MSKVRWQETNAGNKDCKCVNCSVHFITLVTVDKSV